MNAYHTVPHCLDTDSDHCAAKSLPHCFSTVLPSSFSVDGSWPEINGPQAYRFAEAALSPAKYALFQILGCKLVHVLGLSHLSTTVAGAAKTGLIGGMILALLYFVLLTTRKRPSQKDEDDIEPISTYGAVLLQETAYSSIAAIAGSLARGFHDQDKVVVFALHGLFGPITFLSILSVALGVSIGVYWSIERFRDWRSGYW